MGKSAIVWTVIAVMLYFWELWVPMSWYEPSVADIDVYLKTQGYPLEVHQVTTEDGYILTLHRISHGRFKNQGNIAKTLQKKKTPVLLMHGLLCSSMDWLVLGPEKSLGMILADAGYDVWLGNNRGNTYSRKHTHLDPDKDREEFYDYSYHEIGEFDLPAMIDYILDTTGYKKLSYVGFSEGFTSFVVMGSILPEYNDKILIMNALAPVTNMYQIRSFVFNLLADYPIILKAANFIGYYEMLSRNVSSKLLRLSCNINWLCNKVFQLNGFSKEQLPNKEQLKSLLSNFPSGASLKQMNHYVQGTRKGTFSPYDYETEKINNDVYGKKWPPSYDLSKVTAPIILYYGESDVLVNNTILLNTVAKQLPNVVEKIRVPYPNFNHLDFLWGNETSLLTKAVLNNINKFNKKNELN